MKVFNWYEFKVLRLPDFLCDKCRHFGFVTSLRDCVNINSLNSMSTFIVQAISKDDSRAFHVAAVCMTSLRSYDVITQ